MRLRIAVIGNDPTVAYAADELVRYIKLIDPSVRPDVLACDGYDPTMQGLVWLGMDPVFGEMSANAKADPLDDSMYICVENAAGVITGSSPRMVLAAVYRFLKALGCDWVRPGPDGGIIPARKLHTADVAANVDEKASYRHRAITIEGAVSYEHVMNMVDWLPKQALNGYYIQFRTPFTFFDRWYSHNSNPTYEKEPLTRADVRAMHRSIEREIKKRGLLYHATGHGWTCEPFGIAGDEWRSVDYDLPDDVREKLAMVDGKRDIWRGVSLNTNLCYSRADVRDTVTSAIVDYCIEHPAIDYLHFWLADDKNNNCECPECQKRRPSDFYVMMLNELDEKLTRANVPTKVVFLVYVDLLWAPEYEKIKNPDRFVLMFAPITRTYTHTFLDGAGDTGAKLSPFVRNKLVMPQSVEENMAALRDWQADFSGDSFDFDYHLMWDHLKDPGYAHNARVLFEDMKNLDKLGMNGMLSCQLQRVALPDSLPIYAMASALWNKQADYDAVADGYFAAAFGHDGRLVREYLEKVSDLSTPPYLRMELPAVSPGLREKYEAIAPLVDGFRSVIERNIENTEGGVQASWQYLDIHGDMLKLLAAALAEKCAGNTDAAREKFAEFEKYVQHAEHRLYNVLDVFEILLTISKVIERDA